MVKAMKQHNSPSTEKKKGASPSKIDSLQSEIVRIQEEYEEQIKDLAQQLEMSQEKNSELELNIKLQTADYERDVNDLRS